jgi:hypothetical protein
MIIQINNPEDFTLIHKKTGLKVNTFNSTFISYDDEKWYKKGEEQQKLL